MVEWWFEYGWVALGLWYLLMAFFVGPWLLLRRIISEFEKKYFQKLILAYITEMLTMEFIIKDTDGKDKKTSLFDQMLERSGDYIIFRGEQWLNAQKSAFSRSIDQATMEASPLMPMVGKFLPKKYKSFAPIVTEYLAKGGLGGGTSPPPSPGAPRQNGTNKII